MDATFNPGDAVSNTVFDVALQPDGKIIVAGHEMFGSGSVAQNNLTRFNADGSVDATFSTTILARSISALALQPDGKLLVCGVIHRTASEPRAGILRLNADGPRPCFQLGTGQAIRYRSDGPQSDGKFSARHFPYYTAFRVINRAPQRYGSLDNLRSNQFIIQTALLQLGAAGRKVVIGGNFNRVNGLVRNGIARLNVNGSYDTTFTPGTNVDRLIFHELELQPDGKILGGGTFYSDTVFNGTPPTPLVRLNADGTPDTSFVDPGLGSKYRVFALALQPDEKILVGGTFNATPTTGPTPYLKRLNPNGSLDAAFNSGVTGSDNSSVNALAVQGDGKIIVAGQFPVSPFLITRNFLHRLEGDLFVTWEAGDAANKSVSLPVNADRLNEGDETLRLTLTNLTGGATPGAFPEAVLTIFDDDGTIQFSANRPTA